MNFEENKNSLLDKMGNNVKGHTYNARKTLSGADINSNQIDNSMDSNNFNFSKELRKTFSFHSNNEIPDPDKDIFAYETSKSFKGDSNAPFKNNLDESRNRNFKSIEHTTLRNKRLEGIKELEKKIDNLNIGNPSNFSNNIDINIKQARKSSYVAQNSFKNNLCVEDERNFIFDSFAFHDNEQQDINDTYKLRGDNRTTSVDKLRKNLIWNYSSSSKHNKGDDPNNNDILAIKDDNNFIEEDFINLNSLNNTNSSINPPNSYTKAEVDSHNIKGDGNNQNKISDLKMLIKKSVENVNDMDKKFEALTNNCLYNQMTNFNTRKLNATINSNINEANRLHSLSVDTRVKTNSTTNLNNVSNVQNTENDDLNLNSLNNSNINMNLNISEIKNNNNNNMLYNLPNFNKADNESNFIFNNNSFNARGSFCSWKNPIKENFNINQNNDLKENLKTLTEKINFLTSNIQSDGVKHKNLTINKNNKVDLDKTSNYNDNNYKNVDENKKLESHQQSLQNIVSQKLCITDRINNFKAEREAQDYQTPEQNKIFEIYNNDNKENKTKSENYISNNNINIDNLENEKKPCYGYRPIEENNFNKIDQTEIANNIITANDLTKFDTVYEKDEEVIINNQSDLYELKNQSNDNDNDKENKKLIYKISDDPTITNENICRYIENCLNKVDKNFNKISIGNNQNNTNINISNININNNYDKSNNNNNTNTMSSLNSNNVGQLGILKNFDINVNKDNTIYAQGKSFYYKFKKLNQ